MGQAIQAKGKETTLQIVRGKYQTDVTRISVHGREELTNAENARDSFVLRLLQGKLTLQPRHLDPDGGPSFIDSIWFPPPGARFTRTSVDVRRISMQLPLFNELNKSQREVAVAMMSGSVPLIIAHGNIATRNL